MNTKKLVAGIFLVLGILGLSAAEVFSADAWYTCTINRIGGYTADSGIMYVQLTDTKSAFSKTYFRIPEGRLNQMMAVLLTAASNDATVYVKTDPAITTQSQRVLKVVYYNAP
jgi:hypothetical protein